MRLIAYLKLTIKGVIRELPSYILSYGIYPIFLALILGYVQEDMFVPVIDTPIFSITIEDEDNSPASKGLISFFNNEEISKIITVKEEPDEEIDYIIRIPKNYELSLVGEDDAVIIVDAEERASTSMGNLLVNIIDRYNNEAGQGLVIKNKIMDLSLSDLEKENIISEINETYKQVYDSNPIENNIHKVTKNLDSYEYFSITFLSFVFIMFILGVIMSDALQREGGFYNRIMSTTITQYGYYNLSLMGNYLHMIIANIIYVGVFRLIGLSFSGSLPILILIILVQSFLITVLGTTISYVFKRKIGQALVQLFLFYQVLFGGMIGPMDKIGGNQIFISLAKYRPDVLILNTYKNYMINNNLSSITNYILLMLGISLVLYLINILVIRMKWGVNK